MEDLTGIVGLRQALMANPDVAKMIVPSARFEIYMDLNGDGKPDFGFIDSTCDFTGHGPVDTFAIDLGQDGEFDLYLRDTDGNWVSDEITYFKDGQIDPIIKTHPEKSREMIETALQNPAMVAITTINKLAMGKGTAEEFKAGMQAYINGVRAALRAVYAAYQQGKQQ